MASHTFQPPTGLRDFYPQDLLRRRYIEKLWRDTSIRHGFEEIDGPTFEHVELYKVKSGDGILNEMFGVFSGKDEAQRAAAAKGEAPYALRAEFTPTLARMYASKAASLPKPTKWFWMQNCFRAEKPQRGRLREFGQWNCDVIGDSNISADLDIVVTVVECMIQAGLSATDISVDVNHRSFIHALLTAFGVPPEHFPSWMNLLDKIKKIDRTQYLILASDIGTQPPTAARIRRALESSPYTLSGGESAFNEWAKRTIARYDKHNIVLDRIFDELDARMERLSQSAPTPETLSQQHEIRQLHDRAMARSRSLRQRMAATTQHVEDSTQIFNEVRPYAASMKKAIHESGYSSWIKGDPSLARGLAYYTGMVFEVIAEGERAVAGGGRYDNLIELFGGPPTPAVGFGMGDVVLGNLLEDKGLMPTGRDLLNALAEPAASFRPDAFVISNGTPEADAAVRPVVAKLRRGTESRAWLEKTAEARKPWDADRYRASTTSGSTGDPAGSPDSRDGAARPLHARHTYKTTKNVGKLLKEAADQHAKFAVIIESGEHATIKNLETKEEVKEVPIGGVASEITRRL